MSALTLATKFTAVDATGPATKSATRNFHDLASAANTGLARQERLFRKLTPSLTNATKQLLSYASAGAAIGAVAFSGKAIIDYETAIHSLQAVTGVSDQSMEGFKTEIIDTAFKTKKSATDIAGSFEVIGSAMSQYLTDPKALNQISNAGIVLAKASRQELVPTLENLTSIMNQFDIKANQATETINRLTAGEIVGSLRTSNVAEALQEFGAGAYSANINLSESVALVEALAKQMKQDKIGVGARNIITVLDSAKGLDKKARRDLRKSGVDLSFLMDKTHSLSERLHELSKISGNATVITSVFGKENRTAAQVIFNQLGTYDAYLAKIKTTNEAQRQAAINSDTVAVKARELKDRFINYLVTSDKVATGMVVLKDGLAFVADNIDGIITVATNAIKVFALWKASILIANGITIGMNIVLGVQNVLMLKSAALIEGNIIAQKAAAITEGVWAASIAITTGNFAALNAVMLANPIGLLVVGAATLAGTLYFLKEREKELILEYKKKIDLDIINSINNETDAVKKLASKYWDLGQGIKDATANAIKYRNATIDYQRHKVEERIKQTKSDIVKENNKKYFADNFSILFNGGYKPQSGKRAELQEQLYSQQKSALQLASASVSEARFSQSQIEKGTISAKDIGFGGAKKNVSPEVTPNQGGNKEDFRFFNKHESYNPGFNDLIKALFGKNQEKQKILIEFKNAPAGMSATTTGSNISVPNSY